MKIDTAKPDTLGAFLTPLQVQPEGWHDGRTTWRILAPLQFYSARLNLLLTVPAGTLTDFASVPRLPVSWWLMSDYGHAAAALHDFFWESDTLTRKENNLLFYDALLVSCVPRWRAWLMYRAVAAFSFVA